MKTKLLSLFLAVVMVIFAFGMMSVSASTTEADATAECYWKVDGDDTVTYGTFNEAVTAANTASANSAMTITLQNNVGKDATTGYSFNIPAEGVVVTIKSVNDAGFVGGTGINTSARATDLATVILDGVSMTHDYSGTGSQPFLYARGANARIIANNCTFYTKSGCNTAWGHMGSQQKGTLELNNCTVTADGNVSNPDEALAGVFFFNGNQVSSISLNDVAVNTPNNELPFFSVDANNSTVAHKFNLCGVKYDGATGDFDTGNAISMINGASVRTVEGSDGIRFSSIVSNAAIKHESFVEMGTAFYTGNTLTSKLGTLVATNGIVDNTDGSKQINAVLSGITDMSAVYSAQSYVEYKVGATTIKVCSKFDATNNSRSMSVVATAALADYKSAPEGIYQFAVTVDGDAKYSPYTAAQYEAIKSYLN